MAVPYFFECKVVIILTMFWTRKIFSAYRRYVENLISYAGGGGGRDPGV
jgi:hypothetical protein